MAGLNIDYQRYMAISSRLISLRDQSDVLPIEYQKLIAETIMVRLFYELDHAVEVIALKLICGATYADGTSATLLRQPFRGKDAARNYILANNVRRNQRYLEWTMLSKIQSNIANIMDPTDHFLSTRTQLDGIYEDMRKVRNHVAHNSESTRIQFSSVVSKCYLSPKGINAGKMLISRRVAVTGYSGGDPIISQYLRWSATFLKLLTKS